MDNKTKYLNNLCAIKLERKMTQCDMAEILGISARMYGNYERGTALFPINRALLLVKKFNYSLDWIYGLNKSNKERTEKFMVDVRKLVNIDDDNNFIISINKSHWDYLLEKDKIQHSVVKTEVEKKNLISQLDEKQSFEESSAFMEYKVDFSKFMSFIKSGQEKIPYYDEAENTPFTATSEDIENAKRFLKIVLDGENEGDKEDNKASKENPV